MTETAGPADQLASIHGPDGRPQFFSDPAMDRFVPVLLNLASELWVQTELVANLMTLLERNGVATRAEIDALSSDPGLEAQRDGALGDYVRRVLTPLRESKA